MVQEFYYLDENNDQKGPLSIDQLKSVGLKPDTLVWAEGLGDWKPAKEVEELQNLLGKAPPAPPTAKMAVPPLKNAEIVTKEDINSGISLSASAATLHSKLVSLLSKTPSIPLDVFDKIEVIREERYYVPAYQFYCNGMVTFSYESARNQSVTDGETDKRYAGTRTVTHWDVQQGSASASQTIFAPGNKKFAQQVRNLYMQMDSNQLSKQLVDIEELLFPTDVDTHNYNLPQPAAFSEYVKPQMEKLLEKKAETSLSGKKIRGLSVSGCNIPKEEGVRVFLGLYHIVFKYNDKEYSMWATGDGQKVYSDELPIDPIRKQAYDEKAASIPKKEKGNKSRNWGWIIGIVCFIISLPSWFVGNYIGAIFFTIPIVIAIIRHIRRKEQAKAHNEQIENAQDALSAFDAPRLSIVQQFKEKKKPLRGIYENVLGEF